MKNRSSLVPWRIIYFLSLLLVPVTLFLSGVVNSIVIIFVVVLFSKRMYENRKKIKKYKKYFLFSYLFIASILMSFFIEFYYGIFYPNFLERILPFFIFPLVFFLGVSKDFSAYKLIKWFSYSITIMNIILLLFSGISFLKSSSINVFADDPWIKFGVEVLGEDTILAPNGKKTAAKLIGAKESTSHDLIKNIFQGEFEEVDYFRSIFLKGSEKEWVLIRQFDGITHKGVWFNIKEGTIGKKEEGIEAIIEDYGNGWFKCTVFNTTAKKATMERIHLSLVNANGNYKYEGDGKSGIYIWGGEIGRRLEMQSALPSDINLKFTSFSRKHLLSILNIHPSYYALFLLVAIVYFILEVFSSAKFITTGLLVFNVLILLLISSKGAILSLLSVLIVLTFVMLIQRQKKGFLLLLIMAGVIITCATIPAINHRMTQSIETVFYGKHKNLSTSKRLMVWNAISQFETKKLLVGYGKENGRALLNAKIKKDLNAHNQYLEALLMSGIIGLICVVLYLISPLLFIGNLREKQNIFTLCLVTLVMTSALFESILNRQWGIVFVAFFYTLCIREKIIKTL
jgi:O-antigen ligase